MTQIPGGLWYKDHCLEITPYKKVAGVRFRYPGEDWQIIEGADDWNISESLVCPTSNAVNIRFTWHGYRQSLGRMIYCQEYTRTYFIGIFNGFTDPVYSWETYLQFHPSRDDFGVIRAILYSASHPDGLDVGLTDDCFYVSKSDYDAGNWDLEFLPVNYAIEDCKQCQLQILRDNEIVLEETRNECPETVELIEEECIKQAAINIKIETTPLGFIIVSNTAFNRHGTEVENLPSECVNVYNVIPYIPIGISIYNSNLGAIYEFVSQYCSVKDCPPPEVSEIDLDTCGQCPPDTCSVDCGNHICCYDRQGKAIKVLSKN